VPSAELLGLLDKADAGRSYRCPHLLRLVADDDEYLAGRDDPARGGDYVGQQRLAADLVQHFGPLRLQPRPFARRHDDHG